MAPTDHTHKTVITNNINCKIKGSWSPQEDATLKKMVNQHGPRNWSLISSNIPGRSGKSCRLRWCNQLSPDVEHRPFTREEDEVIIRAHATHGNKWSTISRLLPGRTDNAIKNHWNSTLRRRGVGGDGLIKRSPVDGFETTTSDCGFVKRQCSRSSGEESGCDGPETVLTLLPPGEIKMAENENVTEAKEEDDDVDGKSTVFGEGTCLVRMMRRMVAEELRRYVNELRAKENGPLSGPQCWLDPKFSPKNSDSESSGKSM